MKTPPEHHTPVRALFKDMLHGSGLYMLALLGPRLASFVVLPVVTRHLFTDVYGALDLLQQTSVIISILLGSNFAEALGFFFFQSDADKPKVVGTIFGGALALGTLAGATGWLLSPLISSKVFHGSEYIPFLRLIFAVMPLSFLLEAGTGWLRVENRSTIFAGMALTRTAIGAIGTIVLLSAFHMRIGGVLGSNVAAGVIVALITAAIATRTYHLRFDPHLFKRMLRFAAPLSLSAIASFVIHFGDRFVIPLYLPKTEWGIYAMAYNIGMLVSMVQLSMGSYWAAQVFQIVKRPDAGWVFARSFTYYIGGLLFCGIGLLVACKPALALLATPAYFRATQIIPIVLAAYLLRSTGDFFRFVFIAKGVPQYDAICTWLTAAVSMSMYFVLIPRYGIRGAAVASLIAFVFAAILATIWVHKVWPYQLEAARLIKLGFAGAFVTVIYFLWPHTGLMMQIASGSALILLFVVILLALRFATPGEIATVKTAADRLKAWAS